MRSDLLFIRIIAGEFGGRPLLGPSPGTKGVRPMLDRVKESLFDILARHIPGMRILDLCSGTGSLGLEALSRGAKSVTFVEKDSRNIKVIQDNIETLGVGMKCHVIKAELPLGLGFLKDTYDMCFFDPPFASDLCEKVLPRLYSKKILTPNAIVIVQRDRRSTTLKTYQFVIDRRHRIGDSELWFLRNAPANGKKKGKTDGDDE